MEVGSAGQTLRRDGLDDVPCDDALLEVSDETFVSTLSNIRDRLVSEPDGRLGDFGSIRAEDDLSEAADFSNGGVIYKREVIRGGFVGAEYV